MLDLILFSSLFLFMMILIVFSSKILNLLKLMYTLVEKFSVLLNSSLHKMSKLKMPLLSFWLNFIEIKNKKELGILDLLKFGFMMMLKEILLE